MTLVNKVTDPSAVDAEVARLMSMNDSIHFHAWTPADLLELFSRLQRDLRLPFNVELFYQHETEIIAVLKKTA